MSTPILETLILQREAPQTIYLKIHLYSTLEVKQTTTLIANSDMLMSEVFLKICQKRKYDPKNYVFKMADTIKDVLMSKRLGDLKEVEYCVLKRDRGGAGDIFLRPADERIVSMENLSQRFLATDTSHYRVINALFTLLYPNYLCLLSILTLFAYSNSPYYHQLLLLQSYSIVQKQLVGKLARVLTIDGDYLYILPDTQKSILSIINKPVLLYPLLLLPSHSYLLTPTLTRSL